MKKIFCRHKDLITIYKNERPTKNLQYIESYEVCICKKCKKGYLFRGEETPLK